MKKLLSLMLVITMIFGTITMTNLFVANADTSLASDLQLVFDLDFSDYDPDAPVTETDKSKGLKNAAPAASEDPTSEFTLVQNISVDQQDLGGDKVVKYIDTSASGAGIQVKNVNINSSSDLTFETWVYDNETPGNNSKHLFVYGSGNPWQLQVHEYGSGKWVMKAPSAEISTGTYFEYGAKAWRHVVYVLDRGDNVKATLTAYVDGVEVAKCVAPSESTYAESPTDYLYISGGINSPTLNYNGKIASVKLYKGVMTEAEAEAKYDAEKADYGIEDTTEEPGTGGTDEPGTDEPGTGGTDEPGTDEPGTDGTDEPGTDEPGTDERLVFDLDFSNYDPDAPVTETDKSKGLKNAAPAASEDPTSEFTLVQNISVDQQDLGGGKVVKYIDTSGANNAGIKFINSDVNASPDLTIEAWIYPNSVPAATSKHIFVYGKQNDKWILQVLDSGSYWQLVSQLYTGNININSTFSANEWHHVVYVLDRGTEDGEKATITTYVDGVKSGSEVATDAVKFTEATNVPFIISGGAQSGGLNFNGKYSQVKIYTGVMTEAEAKAKYDAEKAGYLAAPEIEGDTTIDDLAEGDKTFDVKFITDMDLTSLKEAEYVLTEQGTENTVPVSFKAYNGETKTLTIQLDAALLPGTTYTLTVNGITSAEGKALNGENMMTVARAKSANLPTSATISAPSASATEIQANVVLPMGATTTYVFMVFDATGRVKGAKMAEILSGSNTVKVNVASGVASGDKAKLIFWEGTGETGFVPVTMTATELIVP